MTRLLRVLSIAAFLLVAAVLPALAQTEPPPAPDPNFLPELVAQFLALGGVAAVIALLINVGKRAGWIKDGQATSASLLLNLVGLVGLGLLRVFAPDFDIAGLDGIAAQIAEAGTILLGLVWQLFISRQTHEQVKGVPVIGKSFTFERRA
jgi:hypothetical protein